MSQGQDSPWAPPPQPMPLPGLSCLLWRLVKAGIARVALGQALGLVGEGRKGEEG